MNDKDNQVKQWQDRLAQAFRGPSGVNGERVNRLINSEDVHRQTVIQHVHGFTVLMDAFQDFALQTIDEAYDHGHTLNVYNVALNIAGVRRLRASLNLFYEGYYYDAASLLRTVFEIVFYLGAVLNGYFWFNEMHEMASKIDYARVDDNEIQKIAHKHQLKYTKTIRDKMWGVDSGLSKPDQSEIEQLYKLMHLHVHKSESTLIDMITSMTSTKKKQAVESSYDERQAAGFCNIAVCMGWALMRVLPYLSLPEKYSANWKDRQAVINESFEFCLKNGTSPIGTVFPQLIALKFTFDSEVASNQVLKTQPFIKILLIEARCASRVPRPASSASRPCRTKGDVHTQLSRRSGH